MNKKEQEFLVQKIHTQYTEREHTQLDELKKLDTKVKKPAKIFAYLFGSAGALIMGVGMSLTMTDIGSAIGSIESTLTPGIVIGLAGIFMAAINYPVYKSMLNNRRKKYADKIIVISDSIIEG
ncbi:MAG: dihydropteridine reductase [Firmicutes bacterium]|nr:dihydropteridine reductase [Bacillota bacterium]